MIRNYPKNILRIREGQPPALYGGAGLDKW
jgi:hypothetical protein